MSAARAEQATAPVTGTVVRVAVAIGDRVHAGQELVVVESMKTEFELLAPADGVVEAVAATVGVGVEAGQPLVTVRHAGEQAATAAAVATAADPDAIRPDLAEVHRRHALTRDEARPDAVAKRRARGQRTARENLDDLCDPGTLVEYGPLAIAAQLTRRPLQELIERTPADGLVCGLAEVNGELVGRERARAAVLAYDATVLAGTQGAVNHRKKDRIFEVALRKRLPVVLFAEGGGGRPGDVDVQSVAALDVPAFGLFARLSGSVPLVGIASGRCFAGNAALLGCCDVVIATEDATIGMGGPAMIEGGGLGVHAADDVGPIDVQTANGVVDVRVADEAEATAVARRYLSFFQGPVADWRAPDQRALRHAIPERRTRAYDPHVVIEALADEDAVLELRPAFGRSLITALVRIEGRPYGLLASDPRHLGGAVDSDAADKAARFLGLCDAHGLPVVSLVDTPGFMVGPEAERSGSVRHMSRIFVTGANLTVPLCAIVLRKAYGLGAMALCGGSTLAPLATVGWPTAELGAMGLEGAVKLGFRKELEAIADPDERQARFDAMVELAYERGKGVSVASMFELDDVIDPLDSRRWIAATLGDVDARRPGDPPPRPNVDTW
ncbi:carboxyl transferase domain-containing protein [Patulibacter defluvii]|uniref:carboxyl transferase domain-containing protein n=1 Tax=Patulibacter defluvii TaxID=3095358 RepID=UPI002A75F89C|nr:carboxyl transferase domain-containing protein [Patulibacter sp. DM4]